MAPLFFIEQQHSGPSFIYIAVSYVILCPRVIRKGQSRYSRSRIPASDTSKREDRTKKGREGVQVAESDLISAPPTPWHSVPHPHRSRGKLRIRFAIDLQP